MRIAVLDDYLRVARTLADWSAVEQRAQVTVFDRHLCAEEAAQALAPFDAICHLRERMAMPRSLIERLPRLKFMVVTGQAEGIGQLLGAGHHFGAGLRLHATDLDLQLRRRGIKTIVLAGISTNVGVESTARDAFERAYDQVFVTDAMASPSAEAHANTLKVTFPRIGRLRTTQEVLASLGA